MITILRREIPPPCLELEKIELLGNYKCGETERLVRDDFHNKCYICEEPVITSPEIDHFLPLARYPKLRCEWTNLFWACTRCNRVKGTRVELLNCTDASPLILQSIKFTYISAFVDASRIRIEGLSQVRDVANTVSLLQAVHCKETSSGAENLRQKIAKEMSDFSDLIMMFRKAKPPRKDRYFRLIKGHLQPHSAYAAFKIWAIWRDDHLRDDFGSDISPELLPLSIF